MNSILPVIALSRRNHQHSKRVQQLRALGQTLLDSPSFMTTILSKDNAARCPVPENASDPGGTAHTDDRLLHDGKIEVHPTAMSQTVL